MTEFILPLGVPGCLLRSWRSEDGPALVRHASDREIWRNLRDAFPHPYSAADAEAWLAHAVGREPLACFAIEVGGEAAGAIGFSTQRDINRHCAEVGYWLGRAHWGRGIATAALGAVTELAFATRGLRRLYALPLAWNQASVRVLEKAGYRPEGRLRRSAFKDGQYVDQLLYARLSGDAE